MANDLVEEWRNFSLTEDEGPRQIRWKISKGS